MLCICEGCVPMPRMSRPPRRPHPTSQQATRCDRQGRKRYLHQPRRTQQHHRHHHSYQHHQIYRQEWHRWCRYAAQSGNAAVHPPITRGLITRWPHGTMVSLESAPEQRRPLPSRRDTTTTLSDICSPLWTAAPPTAHRRRCWTHLDHLDRFLPKRSEMKSKNRFH